VPLAAHATDVQVRVANVGTSRGTMKVAVCPRQNFLQETCPYIARVPAVAGVTIVMVRGVPPGIYAVQVHHDINDNGQVDRSLLGIPVEGIGFSRDAKILFGPPRFEDAEVSISGALVTLEITLKFEP
jgi:uncharacterized protein (DUF2141 family)